jgi:uncharacterized protein
MELIAVNPAGRQIIERYAASGFRVSGLVYQGPVLVFPDRTVRWAEAALTTESLAPVVEHGGVELLLLGVGRRMVPVAASLRAALKAGGIALEVMDTGAACRTYNVLLAEDRRVAAALLPPV